MPAWERILIHHSGARDTNGADTDSIARFHVEDKGWDAIGYHALIERVGDRYVAVAGRPTSMMGSHCREGGQNRKALGLCLIGDFSVAAPPEEQVAVAADQCARWCAAFGIPPDEIRRHRDYKATICPGQVPVEEIRRRVAELLFEETKP